MNKKVIVSLACLQLSCALYAQNGWLPPVTFPSNSQFCDPNGWKLIFSDGFDGTSLAAPWKTDIEYDSAFIWRNGYYSITAEHPYQPQARVGPGPCIYLADNVVVSNGTCKLLMKYAPNTTWSVIDSSHAGDPPFSQTADLTSAVIRLPQELPDKTPIGYNNGRFEARMKIPDFNGAWTSFWLWYGRGRVDELDINESWGGNATLFLQNLPVTHYATVAWAPDVNPYSLPDEVPWTGRYPHQNWFDWMFGSYFHQADWHTYTYEWDTASIAVYLDNSSIDKIWKYYKTEAFYQGAYVNGSWFPYANAQIITVGSGCQAGGTYNITSGYPWSERPNCDVRFETKYDSQAEANLKSKYGSTPTDLGQMEIDYLQIWQRHPEDENHVAICADNTYPNPVISGPTQVCGEVAYTLSPAVAGGIWSSSNELMLQVSNATSSSVTITKDAGPVFNGGWVSYRFGNGNPICPLKTVYKTNLYCNLSTAWHVSNVWSATVNNTGNFNFISDLYNQRDVVNGTSPIIKWDISLTLGQETFNKATAQNYTYYGEYISTPTVQIPANGLYDIKWTMTVTDASGSYVQNGERTSSTPLYQQRTNPNFYFLNAYIDDVDAYTAAYTTCLQHKMVSEEQFADATFVNELIEQSKAVALAPYLITDGLTSSRPAPDTVIADNFLTQTKVYPNPVQSKISILPSSQYLDGQPIEIEVFSLFGKLLKKAEMNYKKGSMLQMGLSDLPNANYILGLNQGGISEHIKLAKNLN